MFVIVPGARCSRCLDVNDVIKISIAYPIGYESGIPVPGGYFVYFCKICLTEAVNVLERCI